MVEYLVSDGPNNRYALVCSECYSHNGMALRDEFEYLSFRCAYCYHLNPARKRKPSLRPPPQNDAAAAAAAAATETQVYGQSSHSRNTKNEEYIIMWENEEYMLLCENASLCSLCWSVLHVIIFPIKAGPVCREKRAFSKTLECTSSIDSFKLTFRSVCVCSARC